MLYTPKQTSRLDYVFQNCGEWNDPVFYTDWDFLPELDAGKILLNDGGNPREPLKMLAVTRVLNDNGAPLAVMLLDTENHHRVAGWIAEPDDGPGYWNRRDPEDYEYLLRIYEYGLIPRHGAGFIPEDADREIWRNAFDELRGMGFMESYATDFLYHDRCLYYGNNDYFRRSVMFPRDSGCDLVTPFTRNAVLGKSGFAGYNFGGPNGAMECMAWFEDGTFHIRDMRGIERERGIRELESLMDRLGNPAWSPEIMLCSTVSRFGRKEPLARVYGDAGRNPRFEFGTPAERKPVCGAQTREVPDFPDGNRKGASARMRGGMTS